MIVCLDVQYAANSANAAAVLFESWTDADGARVMTLSVSPIQPYESGAFYKRELPCLLAILSTIPAPLEAIVIDGYVYLDHQMRPGLGARLHEALGGQIPVIGVAKTAFNGAPSVPVLRGQSKRALLVSSIGVEVSTVAADVARMHGAHRIPTLLKAVDAAARDLNLTYSLK